MFFAVGEGIFFDCKLVDTVALSKIFYSDRFTYGLKPLAEDWLGWDTEAQKVLLAYLASIESKNYAEVPTDMMALYAGDDVRMNRMLYRYLQKKMPAELESICKIERDLTPVLFDMEYDGLRIDEQEVKVEKVRSLRRMIEAADTIRRLTDVEFTNSNACVRDLLLNQFGLPVLSTIKEKDESGRKVDTGRATFDKDAIALYLAHPQVEASAKYTEVLQAMEVYRTEQQFTSLFLDNFLRLNVDGIIHPCYNQVVRTGRMSCARPNSQQQNERSKRLIHPEEDEGFISNDYSQIEYRLIVHYIKDPDAIKAYRENPKTDFHRWVAELMHILRKPAKTLNFGMAYGAGKKKVVADLTCNPDIIAEMTEKVKHIEDMHRRIITFNHLCKTHASDCYDRYHEMFPGIRKTSKTAMHIAKLRGYVKTAYGRRRYLDPRGAHKAFNTVIQGTAADIMKEAMVKLSPRYNRESRSWGIHFRANVHDEILNGVPLEATYDPSLHKFICSNLQAPSFEFRVPIYTGIGVSTTDWAQAAGDEQKLGLKGEVLGGPLELPEKT
jgi:DNA polymerase-1